MSALRLGGEMKQEGLSILDALDNLNTLVDANSLEEIEVTEENLLLSRKGGTEEGQAESYWIKAGPDEQTLRVVQETFRVVYEYLVHFYSKMQQEGETKRLVEGINTVMVLVGEAAKKLEHFGAIFQRHVAEIPEYKDLQNFYRNRVIKESFRAFAKVPIHKETHGEVAEELLEAEEERLRLLAEEEVEETAGVHILNDLEVIKRDHLYELFYLKNEAGHDFFTYELARNIKLACDFGEFTGEYFGEDPLLQIKNWEDKSRHLLAQTLLQKNSLGIEKFYKGAMQYKAMELVQIVQKALMALMLAANPRNLIRQLAPKASHLYFQDFLFFLREVLLSREFQKLQIYAPPASTPLLQDLFQLVQGLCYHLYTSSIDTSEVEEALKHIVQKQMHKPVKLLSESLALAHHSLTSALAKHPSGPVFKAVDLVREEETRNFDPLWQGNLPSHEWSLGARGEEIPILRLACPTVQHWIHKAEVTEEFKTFLRAFKPGERLLYLNYQDRTSWKEHARSSAIEEVERQAEFTDRLTVITFATDTDFYNQAESYQECEEAETFLHLLQEHLADEATGYFFPPKIKQELFPTFISTLVHRIHAVFFEGKPTLAVNERLDFIQLVYHFLTLKLIEMVKPTCVAFSSKDGLDSSAVASVGLIALLSLGQKHTWEEKQLAAIHTLLFGQTLLIRERAVHPEKFGRLLSLLQLLETKGEYQTQFGGLFSPQVINLPILLS